jgi:hypothetical protein
MRDIKADEQRMGHTKNADRWTDRQTDLNIERRKPGTVTH